MYSEARIFQHKSERGFSMLEVLIAILVISFGLLGLAGLQIVSLKSNQTASQRTLATQQAYDMADRMRANRPGMLAGAYDNILAGAGSDPGCIANSCAAGDMALYDRFAWNTANADLLPGGSGTVSGSKSTFFTVTVSWTEKCSTGETGCSSGTLTRSLPVRFLP